MLAIVYYKSQRVKEDDVSDITTKLDGILGKLSDYTKINEGARYDLKTTKVGYLHS